MMKKTIAAALILFFALPHIYVNADEDSKPVWMPDIAGDVAFETKYIWRGQNMVDAPVIQPGASLSMFGFTVSYWGNFSTAGSQRRWTEHDYTIDYTVNFANALKWLGNEEDIDKEYLEQLQFSFGHIFYVFPEYSGKDFHTEEFYWGIAYDSFINSFLKLYMDYARGAGSYWALGIGKGIDIYKGVNANLGITFAYNAGQWGYGYKLAPMLLSGELNVPLLKYFTVTPNIYYSMALDRSRKDGVTYGSEFYGGVKVSAGF